MSYLLFVWSPSGEALREQDGDTPSVGDEVDVDGRRLRITKIGVSPLPGDDRPCAYSSG